MPTMPEVPFPVAAPPKAELYSAEEAQAILQVALAQKTDGDALTRSQLLEIAEELGIASTDLETAEATWHLQRAQQADRENFDQFRRQRFHHHLIRYGMVNIFLMALNYLGTDHLSWSLYSLLIWGLAIALHGWRTFNPTDYQYTQEFEKWQRQQQIKRSFRRAMDWLLGT